MPNDVSRPSSVRIVNLHQPVLVTDGDDQVAVARRVEDGVGVGPVRIQVGPPGGIEVVKLIPEPDGIVILVQVDKDVPGNGHPRHDLRCGRDEDEVPVRQDSEIVMRAHDGYIASGARCGSESRVELRRGHLPNNISP